MRAAYPTRLTLLDFSTLIIEIFDEEYKLCSFSLSNTQQAPLLPSRVLLSC